MHQAIYDADMAGLAPAIHGAPEKKDVDARHKAGHDGLALMSASFQLRPYRTDDEDAAIALWLETWQQAYPSIDFAARVNWWRERLRGELVPDSAIMVAVQSVPHD